MVKHKDRGITHTGHWSEMGNGKEKIRVKARVSESNSPAANNDLRQAAINPSDVLLLALYRCKN